MAFTAWHGVPLTAGETIARRHLDPDRPASMDVYRTAVQNWRRDGV